MTQRIDCDVDLRALAPLGSVVAARTPLSGVGCRVRLSMQIAVGGASLLWTKQCGGIKVRGTNLALRHFLGSQGTNKGDLSKFI